MDNRETHLNDMAIRIVRESGIKPRRIVLDSSETGQVSYIIEAKNNRELVVSAKAVDEFSDDEMEYALHMELLKPRETPDTAVGIIALILLGGVIKLCKENPYIVLGVVGVSLCLFFIWACLLYRAHKKYITALESLSHPSNPAAAASVLSKLIPKDISRVKKIGSLTDRALNDWERSTEEKINE